jgi:2,4-dienoyl-CoA reductase-like NADH-dependent reductase (Old Yellow Enzyme family)
MELQHRVVLAPMRRSRSFGELANPLNALYYYQRATPGGLLISEGTWCSKTGKGYDHVPGCLYPAHAQAWRQVTDAVHAKGGYIFAQLWYGCVALMLAKVCTDT